MLTSSKGLARYRSRSAYFFPVIGHLFDTCLGWTNRSPRTRNPTTHPTHQPAPSVIREPPPGLGDPATHTLIPAFVKAMPVPPSSTIKRRRTVRRRSAMSWLGSDVHCLLDFGAFGDRERYRDGMCLSVGVGRGRD
jgi:hypothetical protein